MSLFLSLILGIGVCLVYLSCFPEGQKPVREAADPALVVALRKAGMHTLTPRTFTWVSLASAVALSLLLLLVSQLVALGVLGFIAGLVAPRVVVNHRARAADARIWQLWPDAVDHLRSAIRAGLSLPEALIQLSYRGPEELRGAFAHFSRDYRASGEFVPSLNRLKEYLLDPVADTIIEALKIAREVGGSDLGKLLGTLSDFLRDNARTRSELLARQSWTVNAARLSCVAPWFVLCLMATQPAARMVYNSFAGAVLMMAGATVSLAAYRLMLRIGELPRERRVFG